MLHSHRWNSDLNVGKIFTSSVQRLPSTVFYASFFFFFCWRKRRQRKKRQKKTATLLLTSKKNKVTACDCSSLASNVIHNPYRHGSSLMLVVSVKLQAEWDSCQCWGTVWQCGCVLGWLTLLRLETSSPNTTLWERGGSGISSLKFQGPNELAPHVLPVWRQTACVFYISADLF